MTPGILSTSKVVLERRRRRTAAPDPYPAAHEQARHELKLLCSLVVANPASAASLAQLAESDVERADGALVFGVLLHMAGYADGAQFWWGFAAGCGSDVAASCLSLYHQSLGELRDGDLWRRQAEALTRPRRATATRGRPLLPRWVRTALLGASLDGGDARLPARLAAVLKSLPLDPDDDEYPEVPRWQPDLHHRIAAAASALATATGR
ncbi:hypothetical protein [Kitasatospora griseola]|uniref:hypothetical protein n=1 Tax=Kitasatospora griseola TaxID=2064 RepID=UPI00380A64AF